jgi:hypothetical protein
VTKRTQFLPLQRSTPVHPPQHRTTITTEICIITLILSRRITSLTLTLSPPNTSAASTAHFSEIPAYHTRRNNSSEKMSPPSEPQGLEAQFAALEALRIKVRAAEEAYLQPSSVRIING